MCVSVTNHSRVESDSIGKRERCVFAVTLIWGFYTYCWYLFCVCMCQYCPLWCLPTVELIWNKQNARPLGLAVSLLKCSVSLLRDLCCDGTTRETLLLTGGLRHVFGVDKTATNKRRGYQLAVGRYNTCLCAVHYVGGACNY